MAVSTAAYLFSTTAAAVTATQLVIGGLVYMGVSAVVASALMPKPKIPKLGGGSGLSNNIDAIADFEIIYGETRKGGIKTYLEVTDSNKYMHMIITLAGHEVNSIGDIFLNDEVVTLSNGYVTSGDWNSKVYVQKFTGSSSQNVKSTIDNLSGFSGPSFPSGFRGRGIACLYVRMEYDADVFSGGVPLVTAKIQGKKVYDPRKDSTSSAYNSSLGVSTHRTSDPTTWQYSDEPALAIRDYLTSDLGVGVKQGDISDTAIATAISKCVTTGVGSAENNALKVGGTLTTGATPLQNINQLLTTLNGTLFYSQGEWKLIAGAFYDADASVSDGNAFSYADILGDISVATRFSRRDTVNTVKGTFVDGGGRFIPTDYPQQQIPDLSEDNNEVSTLDLELPLTTSSAAAQRLAKQVLFVGREQITVQATFKIEKAFGVQVGDTVEITLDRYGFSRKLFRVNSWKMSGMDGSAPQIDMTLQETSSTAYQWSVTTDEYRAITANNTTLGDTTAGLTISGLAATTASSLQTDGTTMSRVILSWNAVSNAQLRHYEVEWKPSSLSNYSSTIAPNNAIEIEPLTAGTTYNFRVRAITVNENAGPPQTINATAVTDTTAPDVPSAPAVTAGVKQLEVSWQGYNFPSDFASMQVYHSTSSSGTYSLIGTSAGTSLVHGGLTQNTTHYYKLLAKDFSGNPPTTTPQEITAKQSPAGNGTVAADVQGLTGVPVMTSNAYYNSTSDTTPNQNGRIYFGVSASDPDTQASDGPFPSTIYIRLDEDGRALASDLSSLINLDTDLTQAVSTGGSGILIYENDQNWGWYTPSGAAGGFSTSGGYYFMEGTLQSAEGNIDVLSQWYRIGVGKKGAQGQSGLIVSLNGADIPMNNEISGVEQGVDPRPNNSTTQAKLDEAFLEINPLLAQMSDIPEDAVVWGRFVFAKSQTFTTTAGQTTFTITGGHTPDAQTVVIYDGTQLVRGDFLSASPDSVGNSASVILQPQFLDRFGLTSVPASKSVEIRFIQASSRKWDYASQDWTDNAAEFDSPVFFSPTVLSKEVLTQSLQAQEITAGQLIVNEDVDLLDGAAWRIGKQNYSDANNGIFFGNPAGSGASNFDFAFTALSNSGLTTEHGIEFTPLLTKLIQPTITKQASGTVEISDITATTSSVTTIKSSSVNPNAIQVTLNGIGGGGGGEGAESQDGTRAQAGGDTTYRLIITSGSNAGTYNFTASGGTAAVGRGAAKTDGEAGQSSSRAAGGGGGGAGQTGGSGSLGSGGGGGGGRDYNWNTSSKHGGAGGGAAQTINNTFDISDATEVTLSQIVVGAGGSGGDSTRGHGGSGGSGVIFGTIQTSGLDPVVLNTQTDLNNMFNASATDGYFNHPSGMELRWGTLFSNTDGDQTVTLTTPFTTNGLVGVVGAESLVKSVTRTNFVCNRDNGYGGSFNMFYIMIGY